MWFVQFVVLNESGTTNRTNPTNEFFERSVLRYVSAAEKFAAAYRAAGPPTEPKVSANIDPKVVLVDGLRLAQLMIDHNVGVSRSHVYELKRIDSDYFAEE